LRAKTEVSLTCRPSASAARAPSSTARRFKTGKSQTDRAGVRVRLVAEARRAPAEDFRLGAQLRVNLKADDGFPTLFHKEALSVQHSAFSFISNFSFQPSLDFGF